MAIHSPSDFSGNPEHETLLTTLYCGEERPDIGDLADGCLYPTTKAGQNFVHRYVPDYGPENIVEPAPTAIITRASEAWLIYPLATPLNPDDPLTKILGDAMGMESSDEPVPYPVGDFSIIVVNPGSKYSPADLARAVSNGIYPAGSTFGDGTVLTDFDFLSPHLDGDIIWSIGRSKEDEAWKPKSFSKRNLALALSQHKVGQKNGSAFVPGNMVPGARKKTAIVDLRAVVFDIDNGTPSQEIDRLMAESRFLAIRYTSHSHAVTTSSLSRDQLVKYAPDEDVDVELVRKFLAEKRNWRPELLASIELSETTHETDGVLVNFTHDRFDKHRVVILLDRPFVITEHGNTQSDAWEKWASGLQRLADRLGIQIDKACLDVSRLFFFGRHSVGRPYEVSIFGGEPLKLETFLEVDPYETLADQFKESKGKTKTEGGRRLVPWWQLNSDGFDIERLIEDFAPEKMRDQATVGFHIECPRDSFHSNTGDTNDQGCFAANPTETQSQMVVVSCRHDSCQGFTALDMIAQMIDDKWFPAEELNNPDYYLLATEEPTTAHRTSDDAAFRIKITEAIAPLTKDSDTDAIGTIIDLLVSLEEPLEVDSFLNAIKEKTGKSIAPLRKSVELKKKKVKEASKDQGGETPYKPSETDKARIKRTLSAIPLPNPSFGEFRYQMFDGRPWLYEKDGDFWQRLCTPISLKSGIIYPDRHDARAQRIALEDENGQITELDLLASAAVRGQGVELKATLRDASVAFTLAGDKFLTNYFRESTPTKPLIVYDRCGWRGTTFLTPWGTAVNTNAPVELSKANVPPGPEVGGTREGWLAAIYAAAATDALHFKLAPLFGFASVIIDLLGLPSMVVCLSGYSTIGKSTAQMMAASCWGTPAAKQGLFGTFHGTAKASEALLQRGSGAFWAFDEAKHIDGPDLHDLVFKTASDTGADRLTRTADLKAARQWKLLMVLSSELSLAEKLKSSGDQLSTGLSTRCLDINLDDQPKLSTEVMEQIKGIEKHFGHAGTDFVRQVVSMGYVDDKTRLLGEIDAWTKTIAGPDASPAMLRAARIVGVLCQSSVIAKAAGLLPADYEAVCRSAWERAMQAETAPGAPEERAIATLFENLITGCGSDVAVFEVLNKDDKLDAQRKWSAVRISDFESHGDVYVVPTDTLWKLSGNAIGHKTLSKALAAKGFLIPSPRMDKKGNAWDYIPRLGRMSAIVIKASAVEDDTQ